MNLSLILILFAVIAVIGLVVWLVWKPKKEDKQSDIRVSPKAPRALNTQVPHFGDIDVALQYNIANHPQRQAILSHFAETQTIPEAPKAEDIQDLRNTLNQWYDNASNNSSLRPMDYWGKVSIEAALDSVSMGNWPIGNVLCYMPPGTEDHPEHWVEILRGGNRFFTRNPDDILAITDYVPRMASGSHGEMTVLDAFEDRLSKGWYDKTSPNYAFSQDSPVDFRKRNDLVGYGMPDGIVLFTQLNSCQMCLSRIGNSGISRCYWLGPDTAGGLAHKLCDSVPAYEAMFEHQLHDVADVSPELIEYAFKAFAGPDSKWVIYCTWKLNEVAAPSNASHYYGYCKGQYYANTKIGQNTMWDPMGFFRTVDTQGGPKLSCTVTPN